MAQRSDGSKPRILGLTRTAVACGLVLLLGAGQAENLLVNPGFDLPGELEGWTCTVPEGGVARWSPVDRAGTPGSGSMEHELMATTGNVRVRCSQCVPVQGTYSYQASAWFSWPDSPDVEQIGTTRVSYGFYSDLSCSTFVGEGDVEAERPVLDSWARIDSAIRAAPRQAAAARVFFFTFQTDAGSPVRARLDDTSFLSITLFRDSFEDR